MNSWKQRLNINTEETSKYTRSETLQNFPKFQKKKLSFQILDGKIKVMSHMQIMS